MLIRISKHDVVKEPLGAWQTEICKTKHEKSRQIEKQEKQRRLSEPYKSRSEAFQFARCGTDVQLYKINTKNHSGKYLTPQESA